MDNLVNAADIMPVSSADHKDIAVWTVILRCIVCSVGRNFGIILVDSEGSHDFKV